MKFGNYIIIFGAMTFGGGFILAYMLFGLEALIKYSIIIYSGSIIVLLILTFFVAFRANSLAWQIEPEDDENVLKLNMDLSLTLGLAMIGFGFALALSVLSDLSLAIKGILLILSIVSIFLSLVIFIEGFIPRRNKLLIIYKIKRGNKK